MKSQSQNPDTLRLRTLPVPRDVVDAIEAGRCAAHVLADPQWYTWGSSVLPLDGRYYIFYARWPRRFGFGAWLTHSEVAYGVSDSPVGPYDFLGTALPCRGDRRWNAVTAHNPKIKRFVRSRESRRDSDRSDGVRKGTPGTADHRYYLYFIGSRLDEPGVAENRLVEMASMTSRTSPRWTLRQNQRTGVASSDAIDGPWTVSDQPIVEPAGPITTLAVNPAVCRGPEGTYFMIVKGDKPGETRFIRNQALATADDPAGPFTVQPEPVIDYLDTEDASIWYDDTRDRFYAVFHAKGRIGILTSEDGYRWAPAAEETLTPKRICCTDGTVIDSVRMERPFVLTTDAGEPTHLFVSAQISERSANLAFELETG